MLIILSIFFWLLIGAATAYYAQQRGRDPFIWFIIGICLGLLGLLLLFILPVMEEVKQGSAESRSSDLISTVESEEDFKNESLKKNQDYLVRDWFYLDQARKQQGPATFDALKKFWMEGKIGLMSFVWCEGMENWKKIEELSDLKEALTAEPSFDQ